MLKNHWESIVTISIGTLVAWYFYRKSVAANEALIQANENDENQAQSEQSALQSLFGGGGSGSSDSNAQPQISIPTIPSITIPPIFNLPDTSGTGTGSTGTATGTGSTGTGTGSGGTGTKTTSVPITNSPVQVAQFPSKTGIGSETTYTSPVEITPTGIVAVTISPTGVVIGSVSSQGDDASTIPIGTGSPVNTGGQFTPVKTTPSSPVVVGGGFPASGTMDQNTNTNLTSFGNGEIIASALRNSSVNTGASTIQLGRPAGVV